MKLKPHPKLAGLFIVPYSLVGFLIEKIFKIKFVDELWFIIIGLLSCFILFIIFQINYDEDY